MDIQMPHISGLELIEQMKADEELRRTPIMAVTAYAARGDEERIRDAGAEGYVSKPISVIRFVEAVRLLLEEAAAREDTPALEDETPSEDGSAPEDESPDNATEPDTSAPDDVPAPDDASETKSGYEESDETESLDLPASEQAAVE